MALPTRERKPALIALAVLLIAGLALVGMVLVNRAAAKADVIVMKNRVPTGHTITAEDLGTAQVSGSIRAIASTNRATVIGKTAGVELVPGQVLNRDMLSDAQMPPAGFAMIGLSLQPGQLPGDGLEAGDTVRVIAVPTKSDTSSALLTTPSVLSGTASVFAARPDESTGGNMLVTLVVPEDVAAKLATFSSAGKLGLVKVAG